MEKKNSMTSNEKVWALPVHKVLESMGVVPDTGLDFRRAAHLRKKYGKNKIRRARKKSVCAVFVNQLKSLMMMVMAGAALLSFILGHSIDGTAIAIAMAINVVIGFFTELKAVRSMEALQEMDRVDAKILREGEPRVLAAEEIVPGDIVLVEGGDIVTADIRLIEANKLQANESALTGESLPVSKQTDVIAEEAPLAERANLLFKGTSITRGSGAGIVYATGIHTELGGIASVVEEAEQGSDPLERQLKRLSARLVWLIAAIAVFIAAGGVLAGQETVRMLKTAIILGIAAIPEGLLVVTTIALARGMQRMAKKNALVRRLSAVQTLGSTTVILTDKTGTLTKNEMTATQLVCDAGTVEITGEDSGTNGRFLVDGAETSVTDHLPLKKILETGVLCSNAAIPEDGSANEGKAVGDPMEIALLIAGAKAGIHRKNLLEKMGEVHETAFDPEIKMMATCHESADGFLTAVKGAPDAVLKKCTHILTAAGTEALSEAEKSQWLDKNESLAEGGLRILALAHKNTDSPDAEPYCDLIFLGLVGFWDPPRADVQAAIQQFQHAGIRVVMVTGDQRSTARNIASALSIISDERDMVFEGSQIENYDQLSEEERKDILNAAVFARVSPAQKLTLIEKHQATGLIVGMTGDGVNDAPALKKADIGIAMGKRGEQVAKEAADVILQDDAFPTIVAAVESGRNIFTNIRKFVVYLLSGNMGEIMIVAVASFAGVSLPLLPLQILYINVVNDTLPALALGLGRENPGAMEEPPRDPRQEIISRTEWYAIIGYGFLIACPVLAGFAVALYWLSMPEAQAVTIVFLSLIFARLLHVFNMRDRKSGWIRNQITGNLWVWVALLICSGLAVVALYIPFFADILSLVNPGISGWVLVVLICLVPFIIGQMLKSAVWAHIGAFNSKM